MANITGEEEAKIREWQKRTGGGCIDIKPYFKTPEEAQREADNAMHNLRLFIALNSRR